MASAPHSRPLYQSPPAYGATYYAVPHQPVVNVVVVPARDERHRTNSRFCRAFFWGIVIWVLLSGLVRSYMEVIHWHHRRRHHFPYAVQWPAPWEYQIPDNLYMNYCTPSDGWKDLGRVDGRFWAAETSFYLLLSFVDTQLYFISRGDMSGGSSKFVVDNNLQRNLVRINVTVRYAEPFLRDLVKACEVFRTNDEMGVGLFTPHFQDDRSWNQFMWFETTISLPSYPSNHIIENLETDLPNTVHEIKNLAPYFFENVHLQGSNAPITSDAFHFRQASIKTSNSPIIGTFNTTDSLVLKTMNGNIKVDVGATATRRSSPNVVLSTSNAPLEANVHLFSTKGEAGQYEVATSTSNSPLGVTIGTQPVDAIINFSGSTTNSPAVAVLNPLFEGTFDVHSTVFGPYVRADARLEDPSGRGRKRFVFMRNGKRDIQGSVSWDKGGPSMGKAVLKTTNSPATLNL
ncbi:hypothetical protein CVT24_007363 [Panaeolus cyanescens]|uniref:Uncharacterized protein n=1 Tax=Panaeolus cyanescens TaxID=181874 RepID=A0A409YMF2_9AGAR|nr:hypothetical protein CVT24_007363 [Panaeolus cyanescens]